MFALSMRGAAKFRVYVVWAVGGRRKTIHRSRFSPGANPYLRARFCIRRLSGRIATAMGICPNYPTRKRIIAEP